MTDEKLVQNWQEEIALGLKYKDKHSGHRDWQTYRDYYRNEFDSKYKASVNQVFAYVRSMIPRIYFKTPRVTVVPKRPELAGQARVLEAVDNWILQESALKGQMKSSILDAFLCGIGPIKLGYDSEFGYNPDKIVDVDGATVTQTAHNDGRRIEYAEYISEGMPWAMRALPDELITPYGYRDPKALPWVTHMVLRPLADVRQDTKYHSGNRNKVVGGFNVPTDAGNAFSAFKNGASDKGRFCLLYEIRDVATQQLIVMCEDMILYKGKDTLQIDGLPWEFIIFNEDPEHFWPISDVKMLKGLQDESNHIRTHAKLQRAQSLLKILYRKGVIDQTNLEKLLSGDLLDIAAGIEVNSDSLATDIKEWTPSNNNFALGREAEWIQNDIRETLGFSRNQAGEFTPQHNKTATEANIVEQAAGIRSDERRDVVADVLSQIVRKWNQYIFSFWSANRVIELVGADGYKYWVKYTGDQLKGEYNHVIHPEAGMPVSREVRHRQASSLFDRMKGSPFIDQMGLHSLLLQQTDIIDPSYMALLKQPEPPAPMGPDGKPIPNPAMDNSPANPMSMRDIQGDPRLRKAIGGM